MASLVVASPESSRPNRERLRALDACLALLEDEAERGATDVPAEVFANLPVRIPGIQEGTHIRHAIDQVFGEQERLLVKAHLRTQDDPRSASPTAATRRMKTDEARRLTDRIKGSLGKACLLILEAHDCGAWSALGYRSWAAYARNEIGISRSRSYELLNHARVLQALMTAAGTLEPPAVTPYAASQIQDRLDEAVSAIKAAVSTGRNQRDASSVIEVVVAELRSQTKREVRFASRRRPPVDDKPPAVNDRVPAVMEIIERILRLPPAASVLAGIREDDGPALAQMLTAAERLTEIADLWTRRMEGTIAMAG